MHQPTSFQKENMPHVKPISLTHIKSQLTNMLKTNLGTIETLLRQTHFTWDNLMQPMEDINDELNKFWSPIAHLHAVMETDELRKLYNEILPLLTEYHTTISQNENLYQAISKIFESKDFAHLNQAQRKIIENDLRDFKLAGIHLSGKDKARFSALQQELSKATTLFSENILDATQHFFMHFHDRKDLAGLPEQAFKLAQENAKARHLDGYVITLDFPSYSTAIRYLDNRELRKQLYTAFTTRASDQGSDASSKWDNTKVIQNILTIRLEMAKLIGFNTYAEYALQTKMAKTPDKVMNFLEDLLKRSLPIAKAEIQELKDFAKATDHIDKFEAWDSAYYSEKLQHKKFHFNQEDIRPYFPIQQVLNGMFAIMNKIYGLNIHIDKEIHGWHKDVQFLSIYDSENILRGGLYIDLYARAHKREGAWMDDCRMRRLLSNQDLQLPIAYLTCNFMQPVNGQDALLTHDDVLTLFHEFGHCLHHLLTKVNFPSVGGINGVPWDAVEFPSQFLEFFCWEKESLDLIAKHYQTKEPLPNDLYRNMIAGKYFQTGLQMVRQLEFALFDFRLHLEFDPKQQNQVQTILDDVRKETALIPVPAFNRFQHSFSHIFGGGYAAGYYSYKWAEVLSADAYAKFEENGIFNHAIGKSFMENILEVGGERDPMESFIAFRGRPPELHALLRLSGITATS